MVTDMYRIAHIENNFTEKFAVPRQSGLAQKVRSRIVFDPQFRIPEAFRGLEDFSHIWLIWEFDKAIRRGSEQKSEETDTELCDWRPTVRPPRLGGNERLGVFATRSPFRPNPIGLSCVELESIDYEAADGPVLIVRGADLMNGTPILDVKPYIPYTDSRPEAAGGFTDVTKFPELTVTIDDAQSSKLTRDALAELTEVLKQDPRPAYQRKDSREYTFTFANHEISFEVEGQNLRIISIS